MNVVIIDMPGKQFETIGAKLGIEDLFFPFDAPDHCGCMSGNLSEGTVKEETPTKVSILRPVIHASTAGAKGLVRLMENPPVGMRKE